VTSPAGGVSIVVTQATTFCRLGAVLEKTREGRGLRATPEVKTAAQETEPRPNIIPEQGHRFPLPPHPIAAEQARILVRLVLTQWELPDIIDNALIVTDELVANASKIGDVLHLTLSRRPGTVLIEVWDPSEACPQRRPQSTDRIDGRGLLLVEACSQDWGWHLEESGGKTIWAITGHDDPAPPEAPHT
jgi:hypothetical protein